MHRGMTYKALALLGAVVVAGMFLVQKLKEKVQTSFVSNKIVTKPAIASKKKARSLSESELDRLLVKSPWPKEFYSAVKRVAFCESSWVPHAKGPTGDYGLMQIRMSNHAEKVGTTADLYDPLMNLRVAYAVFREAERGQFRNGFAPWFMSNACHKLLPSKTAEKIERFKKQKSSHTRISRSASDGRFFYSCRQKNILYYIMRTRITSRHHFVIITRL